MRILSIIHRVALNATRYVWDVTIPLFSAVGSPTRGSHGTVASRLRSVGLLAGLIAVGALVACPSDDNGDDAPPGLPSNVRIERGNELLVVIWDAVTATPEVTAYEVKYGTAVDNLDQTLSPNPTATRATISGLTNGTPYFVTVAAINAEGTGPASTPISGTPATVPDMPSNVSLAVGDGMLTVTWSAVTATPAVTAYEVKYGTTGDNLDQTLAPNPTATRATISGLTNGTPYLVTVAAINAEGTGPSSTPISGTPRAGATGDVPTVAFANTTTMVAEDADTTSRTRVADIAVTNDAAGGETLSLGGADAGSFERSGAVLYLNAGIALDFETKPTYSVTVTAADSDGTGSATFTLMVGNVDDEPPTLSLDHPDDADTTPITGSTVNEGVSVRTKLADIVVTDADGADFMLSLALDDTINFELGDGDTSLYLRAGRALTTGTLPVTVTATDTGGRTDSGATATFILTVNGAPTGLAANTPFISPEATSDTGVTFSASDVEGDIVTYSLATPTAGDSRYFEIDAATGVLMFKSTLPDGLTRKGERDTYVIGVQATDSNGAASAAQDFTFDIVMGIAIRVVAFLENIPGLRPVGFEIGDILPFDGAEIVPENRDPISSFRFGELFDVRVGNGQEADFRISASQTTGFRTDFDVNVGGLTTTINYIILDDVHLNTFSGDTGDYENSATRDGFTIYINSVIFTDGNDNDDFDFSDADSDGLYDAGEAITGGDAFVSQETVPFTWRLADVKVMATIAFSGGSPVVVNAGTTSQAIDIATISIDNEFSPAAVTAVNGAVTGLTVSVTDAGTTGIASANLAVTDLTLSGDIGSTTVQIRNNVTLSAGTFVVSITFVDPTSSTNTGSTTFTFEIDS